MATTFLADEFLPLEVEGEFHQIEPFLEFDALDILDVDEAEPRPIDSVRWGYRIPCPGVRYYFFD